MENWDLYDENRQKLGKILKRGEKLDDGEYHLVINAWIKNKKGELLITQRAGNRSFAYMWECTGGSALSGESSIDAAIREVKEELGIIVDRSTAKLLGSTLRFYPGCPDILDVWIFEDNTPIESVKVQEEEVYQAMWAKPEVIRKLYAEHKFEANSFFENALNYQKDNKNEVYYIGFNANNAICNEKFFNGSITLYPTKEKGNIYYSDTLLDDTKSDKFMMNYKKYIYESAKSIQQKNCNAQFMCFNAKIRSLCSDFDDINIIKENDNQLIELLNDKFSTRELLKDNVPMLEYREMIGSEIDFTKLKKEYQTDSFVVQTANGSGGSGTYYIDSQEKVDKLIEKEKKYNISKYIKNIPLNITMIIGKYNVINMPISTQLISIVDDKFKYVGGDFVHANCLSENVKLELKEYANNISEKLQKMGYRGILGIDFILCSDNKIYFMEINPRFQASTFIISRYLEKYSGTDIAELHYCALKNLVVGPVKIPEIKQSFVNCNDLQLFETLKEDEIVNKGFFAPNKSSVYRKIFNHSIYDFDKFEKI